MSRARNIQYPAPRPERFFTNPPDAYGIEAGAHLVPVKKVRKRPDEAPLSNSDAALRYLGGMKQSPNERLVVVPVDTRTKPLGAVIVGMGSLNEAPAYPREIFAPVIESRAAGFILAHNHPSGDSTPSEADMSLTMKLLKASALMGVPMLDHIVIGADRATSIRTIAPAMWEAERAENPPRRGRRKNPWYVTARSPFIERSGDFVKSGTASRVVSEAQRDAAAARTLARIMDESDPDPFFGRYGVGLASRKVPIGGQAFMSRGGSRATRDRLDNPRRRNSPLARLRKALRFTRTSPRVAELVRAIEEAPDLEGLASSLAARRLTKRRNPRQKAGKALSRVPKRRKAQSRPRGRKRGRMTRRRLQWAKA